MKNEELEVRSQGWGVALVNFLCLIPYFVVPHITNLVLGALSN